MLRTTSTGPAVHRRVMPTMTRRSQLLSAALLVVAAFLFAACGSAATTVESADPVVDVASESGVDRDAGPDVSGDDPVAEVTQVAGSAEDEDAPVDETPAAEPDSSDTDSSDTDSGDTDSNEPDSSGEVTDGESDEPSAAATLVSFADDFSQSVQPILAEKCVTCHGVGGPGSPHWVLGTAQDAVDTHLLISGVVSSGYMPPWPATELSVDFHQNRSLADDEIQTILDWSIAGAPLDIDADTEIPATAGLNRLEDPDLVIAAPNPYAGDPNTTDDYRCQIYDPQMLDGAQITDYEFVPDQITVVHHAIGYLVEANQMERALELDGADGRPGWECYGSSGLGRDDIFIGWAPGQDPTTFPEGSALELPPGGFIVLQIHYHYEGAAPLDASTLAMKFASEQDIADAGGALDRIVVAEAIAPAEIPCASWEQGPLCDRAAALADARDRFGDEGVRSDAFNRLCGYSPEDFAVFTEGVAQSECTIPAAAIGASGELVSVLGHMHEIGDWFRMTLNPGTPDELILLDIDDWDFEWQYNYEPVDAITITSADRIKIECGWDRARRSADLEPAYIVWADGTNDEMCFATLTVRK